MRDRSRSAGVPEAAASSVRSSEIHRACGKSCEQVIQSVRKVLASRRFPGFEPQQGNRTKPAGLKHLTRDMQNCNILGQSRARDAKFGAISTISQLYRPNQKSWA